MARTHVLDNPDYFSLATCIYIAERNSTPATIKNIAACNNDTPDNTTKKLVKTTAKPIPLFIKATYEKDGKKVQGGLQVYSINWEGWAELFMQRLVKKLEDIGMRLPKKNSAQELQFIANVLKEYFVFMEEKYYSPFVDNPRSDAFVKAVLLQRKKITFALFFDGVCEGLSKSKSDRSEVYEIIGRKYGLKPFVNKQSRLFDTLTGMCAHAEAFTNIKTQIADWTLPALYEPI